MVKVVLGSSVPDHTLVVKEAATAATVQVEDTLQHNKRPMLPNKDVSVRPLRNVWKLLVACSRSLIPIRMGTSRKEM